MLNYSNAGANGWKQWYARDTSKYADWTNKFAESAEW